MERPFNYKTGFGYCSRNLIPGDGIQIVEQYIPVDWEFAYPEKPDFVILALAAALSGAGNIEYSELENKTNTDILKEIEQLLHYNRFLIQNVDVSVFAVFRPDSQIIENINQNLIEKLFIKTEQSNIKFYNNQFTDDVTENLITARVAVLLGTK